MASVKSRILQFQTADGSRPSFTESLNSTSNSLQQSRKVSTVSDRIREIKNKTETTEKKSDGNCEEIRRKSVETLETTTMASKKTSMSINLTPMNGSSSSGNQSRNSNNSTTPEFSTIKLKSPVMRSPLNRTNNNNAFSSSSSSTVGGALNNRTNGTGASIVGGRTNRNESLASGVVLRRGDSKSPEAVDWKEKFEESEKRRMHVVTLAQKATRDYEELRRRFQDSVLERERMSQKLQNATVQLDALRNASEAAYDQYYKLKKKYDNEFLAKSEALTRVDEYSKENKRLKRQSALIMQHVTDPAALLEEQAEGSGEDNDDKEISYLRKRVQELQGRVVELESELEKTRLAEFETQESVMLMNDTVSATKSETTTLREKIQRLEQENRKLVHSLDDAKLELESFKSKDVLDKAKLQTAQAELQQARMEKNILQRQSLVFMNDEMDDRLTGALSQIKDLQVVIEEDKEHFRKQIEHLHKCLTEKETEEETTKIKWEAKIKALEDEVLRLRERAETAERKLEEGVEDESSAVAAPPPPPPPPAPCAPPPPPPPPQPSLGASLSSTSLSTQLQGTRLKKTSENGSCNSLLDEPKQAQPLDDVVNQIKRGIKLRSVRAESKKPAEAPSNPGEDQAVEEMRAILNNLKRRPRIH